MVGGIDEWFYKSMAGMTLIPANTLAHVCLPDSDLKKCMKADEILRKARGLYHQQYDNGLQFRYFRPLE